MVLGTPQKAKVKSNASGRAWNVASRRQHLHLQKPVNSNSEEELIKDRMR